MKSLQDLHEVLLREEASKLSIDCERDVLTLRKRVKHEGLSFLQLTLPAYCKKFLSYIELGQYCDDHTGFKRRSRQSVLPAFLSGWTRHVFDDQGEILPYVDVKYLASLRLVLTCLSKVRYDFTEDQERLAEEEFLECDAALVKDYDPDPTDHLLFSEIGRIIVNDVFQEFNSADYIYELNFRHGPGAVAEHGVRGSRKYAFGFWPAHLEQVFPIADFGYANYNSWINSQKLVVDVPNVTPSNDLDDLTESCVRVVFVPKTVKGPRTIAIEPASMQFIQQGIKSFMYSRIEQSELLGGSINFSDQSINQYLARRASLTRQDATIDLSSASDRVSNELVTTLFSGNTFLLNAIMACRSPKALLPSGRIHRLNKFASMGSALCFPVESLVFYTLLQVAMHKIHKVPVTPSSILSFRSRLYVYGDDMIVPGYAMESVCELLHSFGLRVNKDKSFNHSYFRESCGVEYYRGVSTLPSYVRCDFFAPYTEPGQLSSFFAFVHQMYERGNFEVVERLREAYSYSWILPGMPKRFRELPYVPVNSGYIGWPTYDVVIPTRYDEDVQLAYVPVPMISTRSRAAIDGQPRLMRFFTEAPLDCKQLGTNRSRDWSTDAATRCGTSLKQGRMFL